MKTKMRIFHIIVPIVLVADIILPFLLAIPYKGYNHATTVMSVLGAKTSPLHLLYNAWTILSGCVFIVFGYVVYRRYDDRKALRIVIWVLFALYGFGCEIISGIFPVNENANDKTVSSTIHGIGSVIGFTALLFAPLLLGILQLKSKETKNGIVSVIFFILSLASFALFVIGDKPAFENTAIALAGLWQRVAMYMMYLPLMLLVLKFLIKESPPATPHAPTANADR